MLATSYSYVDMRHTRYGQRAHKATLRHARQQVQPGHNAGFLSKSWSTPPSCRKGQQCDHSLLYALAWFLFSSAGRFSKR